MCSNAHLNMSRAPLCLGPNFRNITLCGLLQIWQLQWVERRPQRKLRFSIFNHSDWGAMLLVMICVRRQHHLVIRDKEMSLASKNVDAQIMGELLTSSVRDYNCFQIISEILLIRSPFVAAAAGSWDPVTILRQHWSIKVFVIISTRAAIKYYWVMTSEGNCSPRHPSVRPPICGHPGLIARIVSWNDLNRDQGIKLRLDSEFE